MMKIYNTLIFFSTLASFSFANTTNYDGPLYDSSAYAECKAYPEDPLYGGGILKGHSLESSGDLYSPTFLLHNLTRSFFTLSGWVKIEGADSSLIRASFSTQNVTYSCIGTVIAKQGCWSFLKGGFVLNSPADLSFLYFRDSEGKTINISVASASLQPFTEEEWRLNQQARIDRERKRFVTVHVSNLHGERLQGAVITIQQISKDFPFGSAIAATILGNIPYQRWFLKRFNAAVFENELKWYATEPELGKTNYTLADQLLEFVRANQITARGHNIFWENPRFNPPWVREKTGLELKQAVSSRIASLMGRYRGEFIHWDVSNEMLHFDFYEQRLGPNATTDLFKTAHQADPLATMFMNEFNVIETCNDVKSTVDTYIERLRQLQRGGVSMDGIGLQGHFDVPNPPFIRASLDKLATLGLPIWFTEIDISCTISKESQATYLEQVLREGYSHPSVKGIMLWTALHSEGCYQMCLTDTKFRNLPTGDTVDKLLQEWQTGKIVGNTDDLGSFSFHGFLGEYRIMVKYGNKTTYSTFSLTGGDETRHFSIHI